MPSWVAEAENPQDWTPCFSPIIVESGEYVVYIGGYNVQKFYKYNLDTNVYTELTVPPAVLYVALSMSPDETKIAGHGPNGSYLYIYNISSPGWTTSSIAPTIPGTDYPRVMESVWPDNDTIWVAVRGHTGSQWRVKYMKYIVSTDTWTQYTNYYSAIFAICTCMTTDGTRLYSGSNGQASFKYTIATDTYAAGPTLPAAYYFVWSHDRNKLWFGPRRTSPAMHDTITRWLNPDTEVLEAPVFDEFDAATATSLTAGIYGVAAVIVAYKVTEPKNWSYIISAPPSVGKARSQAHIIG